MRRDGGKFRPKHTMPGIAPHVIHTEKPGETSETRRAKLASKSFTALNRTASFDYGIFSNKQSQKVATLGGLGNQYDVHKIPTSKLQAQKIGLTRSLNKARAQPGATLVNNHMTASQPQGGFPTQS